MNAYVSDKCEQFWKQYEEIPGSQTGDSSTLFAEHEYSEEYNNSRFINLPANCKCPPGKDCGVSYQIIETIITKPRQTVKTSTSSSAPISIQPNEEKQNDLPPIEWSFKSPKLKFAKSMTDEKKNASKSQQSNNSNILTQITQSPKIGQKRKILLPFTPSPNTLDAKMKSISISQTPIRNKRRKKTINNYENMDTISWNSNNDNRINNNYNDNRINNNYNDNRNNNNKYASQNSVESVRGGSDEFVLEDSGENIHEESVRDDGGDNMHDESVIYICLTKVVQLKHGKQINEDEMANCFMRIPMTLIDHNHNTIGSIASIKFYNETDTLTHLTVHLPPLQQLLRRPDKLVEIICSAIATRGGNRAYFRVNPKSHLGLLYIKNFILHAVAHSSNVVIRVSNYGRMKNIDNVPFISWQRDHMFNAETGEIVHPTNVGFWIDDVEREEGISCEDIVKNYPQIVPNQIFNSLDQSYIELALELMDEDNLVLLCVSLSLGVSGIISLFKAWGGVNPAFIWTSPPGFGKSWLIKMWMSIYGISEFDPEDAGSCTLKLDDYTAPSIQDQGNEMSEMDIICEDLERKGNKCTSGGVETFIWTGSGHNKSKTRGGGDVGAIKSIKTGTMNSPFDKHDDGSLRRVFFWLFEKTQGSDRFKNKSVLLAESHKLSLELQRRSVFVQTQKVQNKIINQSHATVEKMKSVIHRDYPCLREYIESLTTKFEGYTVFLAGGCLMGHNLFKLTPQITTNVIYKYILKEFQYIKELKCTPLKLIQFKYSKFEVDMILNYVHLSSAAIYMNLIEIKKKLNDINIKDQYDLSALQLKQKHFINNKIIIIKHYDIKINSVIQKNQICVGILSKSNDEAVHLFRLVNDIIKYGFLNGYSNISSFLDYVATRDDLNKMISILHHHKKLYVEIGYRTKRIQIGKKKYKYWIIPLNTEHQKCQYYQCYKDKNLDLLRGKDNKSKTIKKKKKNPCAIAKSVILGKNDIENKKTENVNKMIDQELVLCKQFLDSIVSNPLANALDFDGIAGKLHNNVYENHYVLFNDILDVITTYQNANLNNSDILINSVKLQNNANTLFKEMCIKLDEMKVKISNSDTSNIILPITGSGQRQLS